VVISPSSGFFVIAMVKPTLVRVSLKKCILFAPERTNSMALKQILHGSADYEQMIQLRYEILRKPLGLEFSGEDLAKEKDDILIGVFEDDKMLACCVLTKTNPTTVRLRQMAVHKNLQGKGIGATLMNFAENLARDYGYKKLTMHARKVAVGFYEKQGYKIVGDEFTEVTIPHYVMEKKLVQ
jgi:predicted GNAT family N-acyltransferase